LVAEPAPLTSQWDWFQHPAEATIQLQRITSTHGRHRKPRKPLPFWLQVPLLLLAAGVITFCVQTFVARVYVIPSGSMEQTLHGCTGCQNDRVLVDKLTYDFTSPSPGDVVVFKGPPNWTDNEYHPPPPTSLWGRLAQDGGSLIGLAPADERDFVKRVIATDGQTVSCCDAHNRVVVDGKSLDEPYVYWEPGRGTTQASFPPVTVPPGKLWVMGDNRNDSDDSRLQGGGGVHGLVPVDNVIGKVRSVIWPLSRWQGVGDHNPQAVALGAPAGQRELPSAIGVAAVLPVSLAGRRLRKWTGPRLNRRGRR
jgi:signal peptidase I